MNNSLADVPALTHPQGDTIQTTGSCTYIETLAEIDHSL
jgi:hypothetical protein